MALMPQNMFNPNAGASSYYDPLQRLKELGQQFQQNPGSMPGGSGSTGLHRWDRQGYERMLEQQREYAALQAFSQGRNLNTRGGGELGSTRTVSEATGAMNPYVFNKPANVGGAEIRNEYAMGALNAARGKDTGLMNEYNRRLRVMR